MLSSSVSGSAMPALRVKERVLTGLTAPMRLVSPTLAIWPS